jgi:thiol-disulfide isomerase/thioredoxin
MLFMRILILSTLIVFVCLVSGSRALSQQSTPPSNSVPVKPDATGSNNVSGVEVQLSELVRRIQAKLDEGKSSEQDMAPFLKEFDAIAAQHKDGKAEDVAGVLFAKAMVCLQILRDFEKVTAILSQIKKDYPETKAADTAGGLLKKVEIVKATDDLDKRIQSKIEEGKASEQDLAPFLKEFDSIVAKHKDEKTEDVAEVLFSKAMFCLQYIRNFDEAAAALTQIKKDFPETQLAKGADDLLKKVEIQKTLVAGKPFPDFEEKDLNGNPLSIHKYKGKVVLVDFWATWCGPCMAELPNVLKAYQKYHDKGLEIVGINLDRDKETLQRFLKKNEMTWAQFFDGKVWQGAMPEKYGIIGIPTMYLLDKDGRILARDIQGEALEIELAKQFGK